MTAPILEQSQHPGVRGRAGDGRPRFYLLSFRVSTVSDRSWRAAPPSSSSSSTVAACVVACVVSKCLTSGLESRIFRSIDNFDGERQNEAALPGRFKSQGHLSEPPPCLRGLRGATRLIDNDRPRSTKRQSETFAAHRRRAEQQSSSSGSSRIATPARRALLLGLMRMLDVCGITGRATFPAGLLGAQTCWLGCSPPALHLCATCGQY